MTTGPGITDTCPEAERFRLELFRRMTPRKRLAIGCDLSRTCRDILRAGVRSRHPDYTEDQVRLASLRLILGDRLFKAAYPGAGDLVP